MTLYFLGVDGGQSSTKALIGDQAGRVVGYGRGGPCNHVEAAEGRGKFLRAISECIGEACRQAGLDPSTIHFHSACLGFSGGPDDKEAILREIVRAERMRVTDDALIALSGATGGEPGVIVIAGTGSISFGRNSAGKTARAGGWGYVFGDEGGGFDLTRQALRAILRWEEGWGLPTSLHPMLLERTGAKSANELMHRFYTPEFPRPRIAAMSKLVDEAAQGGDQVARELLHQAAQRLAAITDAVRRQLFREADPVLVSRIGGVFGSAILLDRFRTLIELWPGSRVSPPLYPPAAGALIEAYRAADPKVALTNVPELEM